MVAHLQTSVPSANPFFLAAMTNFLAKYYELLLVIVFPLKTHPAWRQIEVAEAS